MEEHIMYSPETGEAMHRDIRPMEISYKGCSMVFEMPGWYGVADDDAVFDTKDQKVYGKAINRLKAKADNLMLPEEIRDVRKNLNMTQQEAGIRLGGGKNAFQKYENGEILPSRAISNLLRILSKQPSLINML